MSRLSKPGRLPKLIRQAFILPIRLYQVAVSPLLPPSCRYQPTCSAYAIEAVTRHGPLHGGWLTMRRLIRCHPWGGSGYDPVPEHEPAQRCRHDAHHPGPAC